VFKPWSIKDHDGADFDAAVFGCGDAVVLPSRRVTVLAISVGINALAETILSPSFIFALKSS